MSRVVVLLTDRPTVSICAKKIQCVLHSIVYFGFAAIVTSGKHGIQFIC